MKKAKRILSMLLLVAMLLPILPVTALTAFADATAKEDAMEQIKADETLGAFVVDETQRFDDDGYIGIPYEVSVYYDYATHGKARAGYMTNGATPVMMYVVNANFERIGTDSDASIIKSMIARGYIVVVVNYLNNEKAQSPDLDRSSQKLRNKAKAGDFFKSFTSVFESGEYADTLTVPAGYDVRLNDVFFEHDKHGTDGTLEEIVWMWNNDFRGTKASYMVKWVYNDGTRKATQNGFDGSAPVWYADAAGTTVDNENGQYIKVAHTLAQTVTDCVKADGTPIDLNLYMHTIYPTNPENKVPAVILYNSADYLTYCLNKEDRPQFAGFLFNGYAGTIADYAYVPMLRADHSFGAMISGASAGGVSGSGMSYATYTFNATQSATAAVRKLRHIALSEGESCRIDVEHIGSYGISKTGWFTQLGAPELRNGLLTTADGYTEAEIAERVNDKINSFVQLLPPDQCSGRTRYDNGDVADVTVDGVTIDGGELQPWAVYDGKEISSGTQANYSSTGGFVDYFKKGYAPQFISLNLQDYANTEYGQQNIMVSLCRAMDIPCLWYEADIEHTFAIGYDYNYGVDTYAAFFDFMGYYLKNEPVSVSHVLPANGGVIQTTDKITVKFIGEVSLSEVEKIKITDNAGNTLAGVWVSAYGNTEWSFTATDIKGNTAYTLTIPADMKGANGVAFGTAYTTAFHTRDEGAVTALAGASVLDENGNTFSLTVPAKTASGFSIRVLVNNDAANTLYAYNASTGELMGSVRVSGRGYHEIDVTDALASLAEGSTVSVKLVTDKAEGKEAHFEKTYDTDNGGMGFVNSQTTVGVTIDGEQALKVVRTPTADNNGYSIYLNMENSYTFSTNKFIKNGAPVTKEDLGRSFLVTIRVYDTVSRPVRLYMNSATDRSQKQIDFDRVYYTAQTTANGWTELTVPYTVYEMKYGQKSSQKTLFIQFAPQGGCDAAPIYVDNFRVEEVFTDISALSVTLVSRADSDKPVKAPSSENTFKIGSTEYATWKDAMSAATSGATVTMLRNYTFTDSDPVNLGGKGTLTIDLGGYRLTANNTKNAPLWISATSTAESTVTLKNGSVILSDTPLVGYGSSTVAGSGKKIAVNVSDVYLTVAKHSDSLSVISEGTVTSGVKVESKITFTDCDVDVLRENLPDKTLNGVNILHSGNADISVHYAFCGGSFTVNGFHETVFCTSMIEVSDSESGTFEMRIPAPTPVPAASFKKGSTYATLQLSGTAKGYARYLALDSANTTPYGAIPEGYADADQYPFAVFMDEAFLSGCTDWKYTSILVRETLAAKPGATVNVLLRKDWTSNVYIGNENWLCFMNGTFNIDLGGHTVLTSQSLFEVGVDGSYTGSYVTNFNVKNGTVLVGGGNMCGAQQNSNYNKTINVSFTNVTFGLDDTFATKRNRLFYADNNASVTGVLDYNLTLTDCTIDVRGVPCAYTVFGFQKSVNSVEADITVKGGALLTDATALSNVTWFSMAANDTIYFEKNALGEYITLSVPNGTTPTASFPTKVGTLAFGTLVFDGADYDVYTLKNDSSTTPYGVIPAANSGNIFAIFMNGNFLGGRDTWKDTMTKVRETLNAHPGNEVQILLTKDYDVTAYQGNDNWLCYMQGSILLDLGGHTLSAKSSSLFEAGADMNYTGDWATSLTVKNGTVKHVNGNVCGVQNSSAQSKIFDLSFENVNFVIDPAGNKGSLFYGQDGCASPVDVTLTLTDCTVDLTGVTRSYKIFSFASSDTRVSADIRVNGGKIVADSWDNFTLVTRDNSNDTFVFGKGSDGSYTTLELPASYTLSKEIYGMSAEGKGMLFGNGVTDGDLTTYTLVENARVTPYGIAGGWVNPASWNYLMFLEDGSYLAAQTQFKGVQERAYWYWTGIKEGSASDVKREYTNVGKSVYVYMLKDVDNAGWRYTSAIVLGTLVVDLGGNTLYRNSDSIIEANNNPEETAKEWANRTDKLLVDGDYAACPTTNIVFKNGTILAGKSTSNNGVVIGISNVTAHDKTFNITFADVVFGVAKKYYNSAKGFNSIVASDNDGSGTGNLTVNLTMRDCTFKTVDDDTFTVPVTGFSLFKVQNSLKSIVIEGGHLEGTMNKVTYATKTAPVTFKKGSDGKYFYFDITAGSVPSGEFNTDRGSMTFVKKSGNLYTLAVKASELGNALVPYEIYDDTATYPFMAYVEGKLVSASTGWKAVQEAVKTYQASNVGATVYILMRRDVEGVEGWFKSAGVFNGTVEIDLGGYTLYRNRNSFLELTSLDLTEAQCAYTTNVVVKNGRLLAGNPGANDAGNANGHIVAVQSNSDSDKSYTVTFEGVTFGISKVNFKNGKMTGAVVLSDNGTTQLTDKSRYYTGKITADLLFKDCTFDFTDSEDTLAPTLKTAVFKTTPGTASNDLNFTVEGGSFVGSHDKVTLHNAGKTSSLTFSENGAGEYFRYELTSGAPATGAVDTDQGEGYFYAAGNGKYLLGIGKAKITGASLNVGADLSMLYYVRIHDQSLAVEDLSVLFALGGKSVTVTEWEEKDGYYVFTLKGIAPQQMAELIDATLLLGEEALDAHEDYSVKQNLLNLYAKNAQALGISEEKLAALKTLIADLLVYGDAAQDYTGYNPDAPILDGTEALVPSTSAPSESDAMTLSGNTDATLYFKSATVRFDTVNTIRIKLHTDVEDASLVRVTLNGEAYALSELVSLGNGDYLVSIPEILATGLDTVYTVTLSYDGVTGATLTYSVNAYAYAMQESSNAAMQALALALYRYGVSADAYASIA